MEGMREDSLAVRIQPAPSFQTQNFWRTNVMEFIVVHHVFSITSVLYNNRTLSNGYHFRK